MVVRSGAGWFACCLIRGRLVGVREAVMLMLFVVFDGYVPYIAILAGACDAQSCLIRVAIQAAVGRLSRPATFATSLAPSLLHIKRTQGNLGVSQEWSTDRSPGMAEVGDHFGHLQGVHS